MTISTGVGLISGIDYESYISQISELSRTPITLIQKKQAVLQTKSDAYGAISAKLTALRDQLQKLLNRDDFNFQSADSSDESALAVTADSTATPGSWSLKVLQLAQADRLASQGAESLDAAIADSAGSVVLQVGFGNVRSYQVDANTTITDLRNMINQDEDSLVTASIVNDGSATDPYRLVLTSKKTGAESNLKILTNETSLNFQDKLIESAHAEATNIFDGEITSSGTYIGAGTTNVVMKIVEAGGVDGAARFVVSLDGGASFGDTIYTATSAAQDVSGGLGIQAAFTGGTTDLAVGDTFRIDAFDPHLTTAQDALISVDGITIRRDSNTFSDVVEGVTFTAKAVTTSPVQVGIKFETGLLNAEIVQFQTNYNDLVKSINSLSDYDPDENRAQPLFADSAVRSLRGTLNRMITSPVTGIEGEYTSLASIGLTLNPDGTLGYDSDKINEAMESGYENVMRLFGRVGISDNSRIQFLSAEEGTKTGNYRIEITAAASRATVTAAQSLTAGLTGDENLTFTVGDKNFLVGLTADSTIQEIVNQINAAFTSEGVSLQASQTDGVLKIQSKSYGSSESFQVFSSHDAAAAGQLGIGTVEMSAQGTDVAGTINGATASGKGQILEGITGTSAEGLRLQIDASTPTTGIVSFTSGIADQMLQSLEQYLDSETGIIQVRQDGISDTIGDLNDRITLMEERIDREAARMRSQFIALEKTLSRYQGMGDYVTQMLAQLNQSSS